MNERRISRLQEQIKQRLAEVLLRDIADPKLGLVTITRVELDSEFTHCKAYWSVMAAGKAAEQKARAQSEGVLRRARGLCQREIAQAVNARTTPHLEFVFDESIAGAIKLNQLLQDLQQERERKAGPEDPAAPTTPPGNGNPGT
ncbi:MAG TPA: 30S ribosome-binding factor RbfA [Planctomycetota bacterium]|nr:30S ribosome-binding factor RbfA [Planctomycetota bacterium]